jgi:hypothetical protein
LHTTTVHNHRRWPASFQPVSSILTTGAVCTHVLGKDIPPDGTAKPGNVSSMVPHGVVLGSLSCGTLVAWGVCFNSNVRPFLAYGLHGHILRIGTRTRPAHYCVIHHEWDGQPRTDPLQLLVIDLCDIIKPQPDGRNCKGAGCAANTPGPFCISVLVCAVVFISAPPRGVWQGCA